MKQRRIRPEWIPVTKRMLAEAPVIQNIDEARRLFDQTIAKVADLRAQEPENENG